MRSFELTLPKDLNDAAKQAQAGAVPKAAGIDLIDRMKERIEAPEKVVNLLALRSDTRMNRIDAGLAGISLGSLVTLAQIAENQKILGGEAMAVLREAAGEAATPQVRNRATLGGNLLQQNRCWYFRSAAFGCSHNGRAPGCRAIDGENRYHAVLKQTDCNRVHPSNLAPALFVLDAIVTVAGPSGERTFPITQLYPEIPAATTPEHTLKQGEILVEVRFGNFGTGTRSAYRESREKLSFDWATTAAATRLVVEAGKITDARICLSAVAPVPVLATAAAQSLIGKAPSREAFLAAAKLAYADARPLTHNAYKVQVGQATLVDALVAAAGMK